VRTIPASGLIVHHRSDPHLAKVLAMGCWSAREAFAREPVAAASGWSARLAAGHEDGSAFEVLCDGAPVGRIEWSLIGGHNVDNALAAIAAARHAGVPAEVGCQALCLFSGIKRRMELRGEVRSVRVYDDFAHHPTAIATTLEGLRRRVGDERIVAVLEPRSNTMRQGVHREQLAPSLTLADEVWLHVPAEVRWDPSPVLQALGGRGHVSNDVDALATELAGRLHPGEHALIMSNGGFGGLHEKLLAALAGTRLQEETR
jgi:UDP-N-acetylmuramate: L-alanyl-gamma-D-glutamyl-meso-diaminopimelate ligase